MPSDLIEPHFFPPPLPQPALLGKAAPAKPTVEANEQDGMTGAVSGLASMLRTLQQPQLAEAMERIARDLEHGGEDMLDGGELLMAKHEFAKYCVAEKERLASGKAVDDYFAELGVAPQSYDYLLKVQAVMSSMQTHDPDTLRRMTTAEIEAASHWHC